MPSEVQNKVDKYLGRLQLRQWRGRVSKCFVLKKRKRATDKCSGIIVYNHNGKNSVFSKIKANIW